MEHNRCAVLSCDNDVVNQFSGVLLEAGYDRPQCLEDVGVAKLGRYEPRVLMIDFDHIRSDKLESIRQLRFVLPDCAIVVVSSDLNGSWAMKCHMAGANAVLSSRSRARDMLAGVQRAVRTGCYTDPAFAATRRSPELDGMR
jgi:DNA-binding NarL/FixJ family response regulator